MNYTKFLPNDPKLTAYALGELDGFDRVAVEAALRENPAARAAVEEIRALAGQLEGALAMEATAEAKSAKPAASSARAAIIPGNDLSKLDGGPLRSLNGHKSPFAKVIKFPLFYYVAGGLAAACFALLVALRPPKPPAPRTIVTQLHFAPASASALAPRAASLPVTEAVGGGAASEKDQLADATAAAPAIVVNLTGGKDAAPAAPPASSPMLSGNLSLLAQAQEMKKETSPQIAAGNLPAAPYAFSSGAQTPNPTVNGGELPQNGGREAAKSAAVGALRVSSTVQPLPVKAMMVTDAAAEAATSVAQAPVADFKQTIKPAGSAFNTLGGSIVAGTFAGRGGAWGGGSLAISSRDGAIFSENRGRLGYIATDLDRIAPSNTERYADVRDNEFLGAAQNRLSTFAVDVDTASYSNVRRFLRGHQKPPREAVRIEELVNYFPYRYQPPTGAVPFAASIEAAEAPWAPGHRLVRIGLKGREVTAATRPAANLVFLLDVSGSMNAVNRLPLVKESMRLLVGKLRPEDRVAIVTYAGQSGLALESTPVSKAADILEALDSLSPGGSTNGAKGIQLAYDIAKANFVKGGINRVILCTDGDFNVGVTGEGPLTRLIEEKAKSGVALTALGFGMGNLKDAMLERLADHGNGNYGYIDSRREAEKMLVEQVNGTLLTIAKDVKIQVEFNPARVASYRLIGYENRLLKKEDFNNDAVDAGEIGAGHTVTALYEVVPTGAEDKAAATPPVDELRYAPASSLAMDLKNAKLGSELLNVKLRYKEPAGEVSREVEFPFTDSGAKFTNASADFKFAAAVAEFGMMLRESPHKGTATMADVVAWADAGNTEDAGGYRSEFIELARDAEKLEQ